MRRPPALPLLLLLAVPLALPALAQGTPFITAVAPGDPDNNLELRTARLIVGYVDGNGNTRPDIQPDEMLYLDLDASASVTYGDLRLSGFDTYPAGTTVNLTNRDVGRPLSTASSAWFAQAGSTWVLDMDNSGTLSAGDVTFATAPAKVLPGDSRAGQSLTRPTGTPTFSYGWTTPSIRDVSRTFFIDLDGFSSGGGRTSPGDLRITPLGLAPDNAPTRAEFEQAKAQMAQRQEEQKEEVVEETTSSAPTAWRALDWFVVGLAVLNLVGLVAIARRVNQLRGPPRNPFK